MERDRRQPRAVVDRRPALDGVARRRPGPALPERRRRRLLRHLRRLLRGLEPAPAQRASPGAARALARRADRRLRAGRAERRARVAPMRRASRGRRGHRRLHPGLPGARRGPAGVRHRSRSPSTAGAPGAMWLLLGGRPSAQRGGRRHLHYQEPAGTYVAGTLLDTMWPASFLLVAVAAWSPRRAPPARRPGRLRACSRSPRSFAMVALALLWSPAQAVAHRHPGRGAGGRRAARRHGARGMLTFRENLRLLRARAREAATDALTGLPQPPRADRTTSTRVLARAPRRGASLALFDLDGFKHYNDTSATPPATRCCAARRALRRRRRPRDGLPAWAATSSASCSTPTRRTAARSVVDAARPRR